MKARFWILDFGFWIGVISAFCFQLSAFPDTTNATITLPLSGPALTLAWNPDTNAVADQLVGYRLYQSTNGSGPWTFQTLIPWGQTNVSLYLAPGDWFWYLTATNSVYETGSNYVIHAHISPMTNPPPAPIVYLVGTNIVSTTNASGTFPTTGSAATLGWPGDTNSAVDGLLGYNLYQSTNGAGPWTFQSFIAVGLTNAAISLPAAGNWYWYLTSSNAYYESPGSYIVHANLSVMTNQPIQHIGSVAGVNASRFRFVGPWRILRH